MIRHRAAAAMRGRGRGNLIGEHARPDDCAGRAEAECPQGASPAQPWGTLAVLAAGHTCLLGFRAGSSVA